MEDYLIDAVSTFTTLFAHTSFSLLVSSYFQLFPSTISSVSSYWIFLGSFAIYLLHDSSLVLWCVRRALNLSVSSSGATLERICLLHPRSYSVLLTYFFHSLSARLRFTLRCCVWFYHHEWIGFWWLGSCNSKWDLFSYGSKRWHTTDTEEQHHQQQEPGFVEMRQEQWQ